MTWILPKETDYTVKVITGDADFSYFGVIHTTWGIAKVLIPNNPFKEVAVKVSIFGEYQCEITFKGPRSNDPEQFLHYIEARLTNTLVRYNLCQLQQYKDAGYRPH